MNQERTKYQEIAILAIVPAILAILILTSFALEYWKIGPYLLNAYSYENEHSLLST